MTIIVMPLNMCFTVNFVTSRSHVQKKSFFPHLRTHVCMHQKVQCPFQDCNFETSVYTTFNAHKNRNHTVRQIYNQLQFKAGILRQTETVGNVAHTENEDQNDLKEVDLNGNNINYLELQLEHNLAALFLRTRTILNISENAMQDAIQQINQIVDLSEPLLFSAI